MQLQIGTLFSDSANREGLHLVARPDIHSNMILLALIVCVLLVALARFRQREVFLVLVQSSFVFRSQADQLKDGLRENSITTLLLILQFVFISSLSFYWINAAKLSSWSFFQQLILFLLPLLFFFYVTLITWISTGLTRSFRLFSEFNYINLGLAQISGLLLLITFFVLFFKPEYKIYGNSIFLFLFLLLYSIRILRSFWIGIREGISWYYLILYLWTLEILPVLILAKLLFNEELMEIIG